MSVPLAGLDDVDWAALGHAYGSAADVPVLLRALGTPGLPMAGAALRLTFGTPADSLPPFADLTAAQRQTVADLPSDSWQ